MRLLDTENNLALKNLTLYLTASEAKEIIDALLHLMDNYGNNVHHHINDTEYKHEVTLVLYDEKNLNGFNERSKILIKDDK